MRGCLTLLFILFAIAYFVPEGWLMTESERSGDTTARRPVPKGASKPVSARTGLVSRSYVWSDINRRKYRLSGDKIIYQAGTGEPPLKMTVELSKSRIARAVNAFGIPEDRIKYSISYRTQDELEAKQRARETFLKSRGFVRLSDEKIAPDYEWIVDQSRQDLKPTMRRLQRLAVDRGYKTMRDLYGMVASFVQSFKYVIPPSKRRNSAGTQVMTTGLNMPQEALMLGRGDCDTVSMLFAGLTANLKTAKVILVVGERGFEHAFVGVRAVPRRGDRFITVQGVRYTLIELTNLFPIGVFPQKSWRSVQRNMYRIIPLS